MKSCLIIYNKPAESASADEADVLDQVRYVEYALSKNGYRVEKLALTENIKNEIFAIDASRYEFVFNLVESVWGYDELLHIAPAILKLRNIRYSGCSAEAAYITADKLLTKKMLKMGGVSVPSEYKPFHWKSLSRGEYYIVKPIAEDGSVCITEDSVFQFTGSEPSVLKGKDDANWFIEDYIDGRELNVSIIATSIGPRVLKPAEIVFVDYPDSMPKIVSYEAKWNESSFQYKNSVRSFDTEFSKELLCEINSIALKCWEMFDLHGYARVDMRTDRDGRVYVIEVNANPCISEDGGFVAACHKEGMTDELIIGNIIGDLN